MNLEQSLNESKRILALGKLALARERVLEYLDRHADTYRVLHLLANRRVPNAGAAGLRDFIDEALLAFANEPVATAIDHDLSYAQETEQRIRARRQYFFIDLERGEVAVRSADKLSTQDGSDYNRSNRKSSIAQSPDHGHSQPLSITGEPHEKAISHAPQGRLPVANANSEAGDFVPTVERRRSLVHFDGHKEYRVLDDRLPELAPDPDSEDWLVCEDKLDVGGPPRVDISRPRTWLAESAEPPGIEKPLEEQDNLDTAPMDEFPSEDAEDWLLDEDPALDLIDHGIDDDLWALDHIDTDYDPHASAQEDLFDSVLVQGTVPRYERALQVARQLAMPHGWDADGISLLADIFEQHGWSACQRSMRRELENGLTEHELAAAFECRELWSNHPEFSARVIRRRTRQRSTRTGTSDYYKALSWPDALRLVRAFPGRSDCAEIEYFLLEAYDHWYGSPALWPELESFRAYLLMQLPHESHCDQPWVNGQSEYSCRVADYELEIDPDWPVWDSRHQRLEQLFGLPG